MSRIPTDLTRDLTCLVKASNLSCSQVIRRRRPITAALHAQIKTWLWAICKNGCLPSRLSCCVRRVRPSPGCETTARSRMWSRPRGRTDAGWHPTVGRGRFPPQAAASLSPGPRTAQTPAIGGATRLLSPKGLQAASGGLLLVSGKGCVPGREQTSQA